jgi:hypothetical protein
LRLSVTALSRSELGSVSSNSQRLQLSMTVIPEPTTSVLLAVGLVCLGGPGSRRRRSIRPADPRTPRHRQRSTAATLRR